MEKKYAPKAYPAHAPMIANKENAEDAKVKEAVEPNAFGKDLCRLERQDSSNNIYPNPKTNR